MAPAAVSFSADPYFRQQIQVMPAPDEGCMALMGQAALKLAYKQTGRAGCNQPTNEFPKFREVKVTSHTPVPFENHKNSKGMDMSSSSVVRKLPSTTKGITKAETAERVKFALQAWGRDRVAPIKCLQRFTGVSRKAAEAWWHGRNPPQSDHLFTLARNIPELKSEVARLLDLEQNHAESFQREAIALLQRYAR